MLKNKKIFLYAPFFSLSLYGCSNYYMEYRNANGNQCCCNNPSTPSTPTAETGTVNFFVSGSYDPGKEDSSWYNRCSTANSTIHSAIMRMPFSLDSKSFSDNVTKMKDPFAELNYITSSYTRKVTCIKDKCVAIGGYHLECIDDAPQEVLAHYYGDYGGSVSITLDGGSRWSHPQTPFELLTEDYSQPHSSINDVTCTDGGCIAIGLYSNYSSRNDREDSDPQIAYSLDTGSSSQQTSWTRLDPYYIPVSRGKPGVFQQEENGKIIIEDPIKASRLRKVYCFDKTKCFILAEVYSGRLGKFNSVILSSSDMKNWIWIPKQYVPYYPKKSGYETQLNGISCVSSTLCFAIGKKVLEQSPSQVIFLASTDGGLNWNSDDFDGNTESKFANFIRGYLGDYYDENGVFSFGTDISCSAKGNGICMAIANYHSSQIMQGPAAIQGALFKRNVSGDWSMLLTMDQIFKNATDNYSTLKYNSVICYNDTTCLVAGEYYYSPMEGSEIDETKVLRQRTGFVAYTADAGATWSMKDSNVIDEYNGYLSKFTNVNY